MFVSRLAIGTAQFGMSYGIANSVGQVSLKEVSKILALARKEGVDTLDTAIAYGESERVLGQIGVDSEVGQGSTFWFQIPLQKADLTTALNDNHLLQAEELNRKKA